MIMKRVFPIIMVIFMSCSTQQHRVIKAPIKLMPPLPSKTTISHILLTTRTVTASWTYPDNMLVVSNFVVTQWNSSNQFVGSYNAGITNILKITFPYTRGMTYFFNATAEDSNHTKVAQSNTAQYPVQSVQLPVIGFIISCNQPSLGEVQQSTNLITFVTFTNTVNPSVYIPMTEQRMYFRTKNFNGVPTRLTISNVYAQ